MAASILDDQGVHVVYCIMKLFRLGSRRRLDLVVHVLVPRMK